MKIKLLNRLTLLIFSIPIFGLTGCETPYERSSRLLNEWTMEDGLRRAKKGLRQSIERNRLEYYRTADARIMANPNDIEAYLQRATYGRSNEQIAADYQRYHDVETGTYKSHSRHADALLELNRFRDAIVEAGIAIQMNPGGSGAYEARAQALLLVGANQAAHRDATRAYELEPKSINYRFLHGITLVQIGRCREALEEGDFLLTKNPSNGPFYLLRGDSLLCLGKKASAVRAYRKGMKLIEERSADSPALTRMIEQKISIASGAKKIPQTPLPIWKVLLLNGAGT